MKMDVDPNRETRKHFKEQERQIASALYDVARINEQQVAVIQRRKQLYRCVLNLVCNNRHSLSVFGSQQTIEIDRVGLDEGHLWGLRKKSIYRVQHDCRRKSGAHLDDLPRSCEPKK